MMARAALWVPLFLALVPLRLVALRLKSSKYSNAGLPGVKARLAEMGARLAVLEAEKGDLAKYATTLQKTVLFHAQLAGDVLLGEGARILFDRVVINQGDAYNATLGEFTAPYNGFYFFTATAMGFTDQDWPLTDGVYARMKMKVDGSTVVRIRSLSIDYYETGTGTYAAHLTAGQQVWLQAYGESNRFDDKETTFSGFLVRADD